MMRTRVFIIIAVVIMISVPNRGDGATIELKNGMVIDGRIIAQTSTYLKIDFQGIAINYYLNEIAVIDGVAPKAETAAVSAAARYQQGLTHVIAGNFDQANDEFGLALKLDVTFDEAGDCREIIRDLKKESIDSDAAAILIGAIDDIGNNRELALPSELETIIVSFPDYPGGYYYLGLIYDRLGRYDQAEGLYQRTLNHDPKFVRALVNIGIIYENKGNHQKALDHFYSAIRVRANDAKANFAFALFYLNQEQLQHALRYLKKARRHAPDNPAINWELGMLYESLGQRKNAVKWLTIARQLLIKRGEYLAAQEIEDHLAK